MSPATIVPSLLVAPSGGGPVAGTALFLEGRTSMEAMKPYRSDTIMFELMRNVDRAAYAWENAKATNFKVAEAGTALSAARRELTQYQKVASDLPEQERAHCAEHGIDVRTYVRARVKLSPERLRRALDGDENVVELAVRYDALLFESSEDVLEGLERIAALIAGGFGPRSSATIDGLLGDLTESVQALAIARDENPALAARLVDVLKTALLEKNAVGARRTLESLAAHFGLKLSAATETACASEPSAECAGSKFMTMVRRRYDCQSRRSSSENETRQ